MASWILSQQLLLTVIVALLIFNQRHTVEFVGAKMSYGLWLIVPLFLFSGSLPHYMISAPDSSIAMRYLVTINQQNVEVGQLLSWQLIWLLGAAVVVSYSIKSTLSNRNLNTKKVNDLDWLASKLPRGLNAFYSEDVTSPMLEGIIKVRIILPTNFKQLYTTSQQKIIIEHELCHFRRKDNLVNLMVVIGLSCCWFNPVAWIGYYSFRKSQEVACDSDVLDKKTVNERVDYSKALLNCALSARNRLCIYSNYTQGNTMYNRINMLKNYRMINRPAQIFATLVGGLLLANSVIAAPEPGVTKQDQIAPEIRIEPRYPLQAAKDRVEGSVVLKFDITKSGNVDNVSVVKSVPSGVFDKVGMTALKKWKYQVSGSDALNQYVQLDFEMDNSTRKAKNLMEDIEQINVTK